MCAEPLSISRGWENGAIKFISSLLIPYFLKKVGGLTGVECAAAEGPPFIWKKESEVRGCKVFHLFLQAIKLSSGMCRCEWRVG